MAEVKITFGDLSTAKQDELRAQLADELKEEIDDLMKELKCDREYATGEAIRSHISSYDVGIIFRL